MMLILAFCVLFTGGFWISSKIFNSKSKSVSAESKPVKSDKHMEAQPDQIKKDEASTPKETQAKPEETSSKPNDSEFKDPMKNQGKKTAYLTFDDGPTANVTPQVLEILDKYQVKATFFVIGQLAEKNPDLVREESRKGHTIGNHTYTHDYKHIYSAPDVFISDLDKNEDVLKNILGHDTRKIIRFPGGSFGHKHEPFRQAAAQKGYHSVDWNALTGDAERQNVPPDQLVQKLKATVANHNSVVILMHDASAKKTTVEALPSVIEYLKSQGYELEAM